MPRIAGYEVVRAGDIGALNEDVVAGVARNEQPTEGSHDVGTVPDAIEKLVLQSEGPECSGHDNIGIDHQPELKRFVVS